MGMAEFNEWFPYLGDNGERRRLFPTTRERINQKGDVNRNEIGGGEVIKEWKRELSFA